MTLLKENLGTDFGNVQFGVQKSYRYHTARQRHYERLSQFISFGIIVLSALWGTILLEFPNSGYVFLGPAAIILLSAWDIALRPSVKGTEHKLLARQFNQLDMKMMASKNTKAFAKSFQIQRQEIESTEPPDRAVLNLLVHNQLCQAIKSPDGMVYIAFWRRTLCQWIDWPPKRWLSLKEHQEKKLSSVKTEFQPPKTDLQAST